MAPHHKEHKKEHGHDHHHAEEKTPETQQGNGQENSDANTQQASKETPRIPKPVTIMDIELEQLRKELAENKDKYLRSLAEAENARKRLQKEKQEMIQYAQQNIIVDFLNPIDHLENALKFANQMSDDVKHWAIGFQMILNQFKDVLTNNGVKSFPSEGKIFDPHLHEAVESIATNDFTSGTIVEESLRGYTMGEKTIRPARVKVAKAPIQPVQPAETTNQENQK